VSLLCLSFFAKWKTDTLSPSLLNRRRVRENALEAVEAGQSGTGHVLTNIDVDGSSEPSASAGSLQPKTTSISSSALSTEDDTPVENPHKYIREPVPPSQRSLRKGASTNGTPSQAAMFTKRENKELTLPDRAD
jgi:hypothetical protein